jgi:hypothetical protein
MPRKSAFIAVFLMAAISSNAAAITTAQAVPNLKSMARVAKSVASHLDEHDFLKHAVAHHALHSAVQSHPRLLCHVPFFGTRICKTTDDQH